MKKWQISYKIWQKCFFRKNATKKNMSTTNLAAVCCEFQHYQSYHNIPLLAQIVTSMMFSPNCLYLYLCVCVCVFVCCFYSCDVLSQKRKAHSISLHLHVKLLFSVGGKCKGVSMQNKLQRVANQNRSQVYFRFLFAKKTYLSL